MNDNKRHRSKQEKKKKYKEQRKRRKLVIEEVRKKLDKTEDDGEQQEVKQEPWLDVWKEAQEAVQSEDLRKGTLSDWLNPSHKYFWKELKHFWAQIPKSRKKMITTKDKEKCEANWVAVEHPFVTESDDHCETPPEAYQDIELILEMIAKKLDKSRKELAIYDPFYCSGAVVRHLNALGFENVYNKNEDFYKVSPKPKFDVLVTNPPYSADHVEFLIRFVKECGKPCLMLMPNYVASKPFFKAVQDDYSFVVPKKRYNYWTPKGLRPKDRMQNHVSHLGVRTSPFLSFWYINQTKLYEMGVNPPDIIAAYKKKANDAKEENGGQDEHMINHPVYYDQLSHVPSKLVQDPAASK